MISRRRLMAALPALGLSAPAWGQGFRPSASLSTPQGPLIGRFGLASNRPWTSVMIEGQGPFRFLIDTGASTSLIDPDLAVRLQLTRLDDTQLQGATGERTVGAYLARGVVVAETLRQRGAVTFAAGQAGDDFDGVLPGAMFTSGNAEIDFGAGEFRIYGQTAPDRTGFTRLPLVRPPKGRADSRLVVQVRLDSRPVNLLVDTGGAGSVLLSGEYVGKNKLWDRYPKWAPGEGQGVLSAFNLRLVRARSLQLGPARLDRPVVHLTDPFNPPGDGSDGVLGMDVLRRFTLSTDPVGRALWIRPNGALNEPFRYNRAGFEARLDKAVCSVRTVQPGSPAARAGIRPGDVAPTVTNPRDMARFDWYLSEGPGTVLEFDLVRDGATTPVRLVLEDLL